MFSDTRKTLYGEDFYNTLTRALLGRADAWKSIQANWNPGAVVLNGAWPDSGALANRLVASRAWKLVYFDGATIILVKNIPEHETLINDPSIQKYGMKVLEDTRKKYVAKNQTLFKTGNSSRLIGAAGLRRAHKTQPEHGFGMAGSRTEPAAPEKNIEGHSLHGNSRRHHPA